MSGHYGPWMLDPQHDPQMDAGPAGFAVADPIDDPSGLPYAFPDRGKLLIEMVRCSTAAQFLRSLSPTFQPEHFTLPDMSHYRAP